MNTEFHRHSSIRLLVGTVMVDVKEVPVIELNGRAVSLVQVALDAGEKTISWQELD
jgi:hypothetical protein